MSESTTPTPEPMTDERLAEIRERAESVKTWKAVWGPPIPQLCDADIPDLLAEVERLRAEQTIDRQALDRAAADHAQLRAEVTDERRRRADYVRTVETERDQLRTLLRDMVDPDPCSFDHHGGCQAHGYLNLQPGEKCPHAEAKELLPLGGTEADR